MSTARHRAAPHQSGLLTTTTWLLGSRLAIALLGWVGTVLIVRALSVEDYGRFTLIFGVLGVLSIVTDLGIGRIALSGMLDESHDRARFTGSYVLLRCLLGVVGYGLGVGFVAVAGYGPDVVAATAVAAAVVVLATPGNAYITVFQAHRRLRGVAVAQAASRLAQVGFTAAIATAGGSLLLFTLPAVAAEAVVLLWLVPAAHALTRIRYRVDGRLWWRLLREAAPLSVGAALATVYYRVDTIMLSQLDDFSAVALYGVAYKFVDLAHFLSSAVTTALLPLLVAAWPDDPRALRHEVRRGATVLLLLGGFVVVQFALFADPVIRLVYGEAYVAASLAARVVVLSEVISFASALALVVLVAAGRHRRYPLIALVGLVVNVGLNLVLIPAASYLGAAVATLVTELLVVGWICAEVRRTPGLRPLPRPPLLRLLVAGAAAGALGLALAPVLPWPLAVAAVGAAYAGLVLALRATGPDGVRALARDAAAAGESRED